MRYFLRSLAAGFAIGLGSYAYIATHDRYLGGFLFSFGMFAVCAFALPLYTGQVSYLGRGDVKPHRFLSMLPANILGAMLVGLLSSPVKGGSDVRAIVLDKLAQPLLQSLFSAMLCGAVIFLIVDSFRRGSDPLGRWLGVLLGVPVFVISRLENSIPNIFYLAAAFRQYGLLDGRSPLFMLLVLLGNGAGALFLHMLIDPPAKPAGDPAGKP